MSSKEIARGCSNVIQISGPTIQILALDESRTSKDFTFDRCYGDTSHQQDVFDDLGRDFIGKALEGYNGTIFAYGQTGSGKTHTMMGNPEDVGLIPRMNDELFTRLTDKLETMRRDAESSDTKVMITASYLEIYNEEVKDLLNPSKKVLKLRENRDMGVYVEDLCELIVRDAGELYRLIQQGNTVRKVAATNMNEQSSRSHSCFTIKVQIKTTSDLGSGVSREQLLNAKINLVDLAGSERAAKTGATGQTLKEGAKINLSLMTLGTVINALSGGSSHVPYRDSKLTFLLSESLGGNAVTVMIAAISPADYNHEETLSTLQYANRAKSIENKVVKNENVNDRVIRQLKEEIEKLKMQVLAGAGGGMSSAEDAELRTRIADMENEQRNAWEEKERLSRELEAERSTNMNAVLGTMIQDLKEQKIEHMKNLKRLQLEYDTLQKKQASAKSSSDEMRLKILTAMKAYEDLQGQYNRLRQEQETDDSINEDDFHSLASDMASMLSTIETDKQKWTALKETLKTYKSKLESLSEGITEAEANIVSMKGILDENDQLRQRIQDEERAKAKIIIEQELNQAREQLDKERQQVRGSVEAEVREDITRMEAELTSCRAQLEIESREKREIQSRLDSLQQYSEQLESRLSAAQADHEAAQADLEAQAKEVKEKDILAEKLAVAEAKIAEMLVDHSSKLSGLIHRHSSELKHIANDEREHRSVDEMKYSMFRSMMNAFEEERRNMEKAYRDLQGLLSQATKDIIYLSQQNEALSGQVSQLTYYEPPIMPTRPLGNSSAQSSGGLPKIQPLR